MEVRASSEQQGVMAGREPFGLPKTPPPSSNPMQQNMHLAYTAEGRPYYAQTAQNQSGGGDGAAGPDADAAEGNGSPEHQGNMEEMARKKSGQPSNEDSDGSMSAALVPVPNPAEVTPGASGTLSPAARNTAGTVPSAAPVGMKKRGRPKGSTNKVKKQKSVPDTTGFVGAHFTPHAICVNAGEDVAAKIMSFSQHGSRGVCVLSANGAISNVTIRQADTSGGTVTYEGRFEILSLSGSFLESENGGHRSRTGGLSVSLASSNGRVLGGGVAGLLTAATPIQIIVGSFDTATEKKAPKKQRAPSDPSSSSAPPQMAPVIASAAMAVPAVTTPVAEPIAPVPLSVAMAAGPSGESSSAAGNQLNHGATANDNTQNQGLSSMSWK